MKPQCATVLSELRRRSLTTNEIRALGIGVPQTRIFELRAAGYPIRTDLVEVPARHGVARVARYTLLQGAAAGDRQASAA
jgi:hypothetical protein